MGTSLFIEILTVPDIGTGVILGPHFSFSFTKALGFSIGIGTEVGVPSSERLQGVSYEGSLHFAMGKKQVKC